MTIATPRLVRAPRGSERTCRSCQTEAALRMLMNNLDPEVAERPDDLVVYGGRGKAARSWAAFDRIVAEIRRLDHDETLLVQAGKPAGSWIYIGTQGILQGTFQAFAAVADQRFGGTLAGRLVLTAGLGGMGGAQPLAVTLNGGVALCVEVDRARLQQRRDDRYLDERAASLETALTR